MNKKKTNCKTSAKKHGKLFRKKEEKRKKISAKHFLKLWARYGKIQRRKPRPANPLIMKISPLSSPFFLFLCFSFFSLFFSIFSHCFFQFFLFFFAIYTLTLLLLFHFSYLSFLISADFINFFLYYIIFLVFSSLFFFSN